MKVTQKAPGLRDVKNRGWTRISTDYEEFKWTVSQITDVGRLLRRG